MSEPNTNTFAGHNYKADYKFKTTIAQKANGQLQIKEVSVRSDEYEPLPVTVLDIFIDTYKTGKEKGLDMVSPFIKGHEPV